MLPVSRLLRVARGGSEDPTGTARHRFGPRRTVPEVVVWNVCKQCNMRCPHCYSAAARRPSPRELDTTEAVAVIDELARAGVAVLIFSGGEPLLRPDLEHLIARAGEVGLVCHLSTNGSLLDRKRAQALAAAGVRYVGVSVDGPEEWNDTYRGMRGGFALAFRALENASDAGMRTGLRMTITRHNAGWWEPMIRLAEDCGVGRFYLSHLLYSGRGRSLAGADLDTAACRSLLNELFSWADSALERPGAPEVVTGGNDSDGVLLLGWVRARYGERPAGRLAELLTARGGNSAGERILCIDEEGRVFPDQFWRTSVLGSLRGQTLEQILGHPLIGELRTREQRLRGRCRGCAWLPLCRGSHRERALAVAGDPWAADPACLLRDEEVAGDWPRMAQGENGLPAVAGGATA